ncbi:MAG: M13 family metallopeptidase [Planctomycetota bacterium]
MPADVFSAEPDATATSQPIQVTKVSGIDQSLMSKSIQPGDNFYEYANEAWLQETVIPADKSNYGIFTVLDDETRASVRGLIEQAAAKDAKAGTAAQKVGDMYASVLNTESRNALGLAPIERLLNSIGAIQNKEELLTVLGQLTRAGVYGPAAPYVSVDAKKSDQYTVYLTQSGLTLPDRDYYLEADERYRLARVALREYLTDLLAIVGVGEPRTVASAILALETGIAKAQWTKTENRDPVATYNRMTIGELTELVPAMPIQPMLAAAGLGDQESVVVRQPSYFEKLGEIFEGIQLDVAKNYLLAKTMDAYAPMLTEALERRHFEFHGQQISGTDEQQPIWKRGVDATNGVLGEAVGQVYVETYFKPEAKRRMIELVENLKRAFRERIQTRPWMTEGTKRQSREKLDKFTTKIGYPDEWKDYRELKITARSPATNQLSAAQFEHQRDLDKLGGPIDRNEWHMTPQTINAYYNPTMNEIVFPAAILQPPFFNMAADDAVNYGAIGAVIGHELSHGFDDKGSKYDGDGNLRNWWTPEDREEFELRAAGLIEQYNQYRPFEDMNVNGELTLGENIGDLGGLSVAYEAYRLSLDGSPPAVIDGLTGDQRFFLGWAQVWRRLYREQELRKRLLTDPHSPSEYRTNGIVRNMDAWYEAFQVSEEDALYLAPEERVRIW